MSSVFSKVRRKIEYIHNKKATYDYAPQQGGWEKYGSPVFGDETTASVFDPFVVMIEDRYRLFVSERKNSGIICTDSTDGTEWEKWKVALEAGDKGSWEERVNRASVCKIDGKWLMDCISFLLIQLTNNIKMEHKTDCMGIERLLQIITLKMEHILQ